MSLRPASFLPATRAHLVGLSWGLETVAHHSPLVAFHGRRHSPHPYHSAPCCWRFKSVRGPSIQPMSRKHAIGTIAIALLLVGTVATPAAAASDTNSDGVLEQIGNYVNSAQEAVSGAIDRVGYVVFGGSEDVQTASDSVDALHDFSEDHGQAIAEYATAYAPENASKTDYDTIRLNLNAGGESTTVFATATIEDGDVESVDVVNATDRSVDLTLTLDEYSTRELPSDLEHVRTHYIEGEESPESIRSFVASKYWGTDGFDGKDSHVRIQEGDA